MGKNRSFEVAFGGLKNGHHLFEMEADNSFFKQFEFSPIQQGNVHVNLELIKGDYHMELLFDLKGNVHTQCDRCLAEIDYPVDSHEKLMIKLGEEFDDQETDLLILPRQEHQVDLSQYVYEYILLAMPMQRTCADTPRGSCDEEMLRKVEFIDEPAEEGTDEEPTDPRWNDLKNLLN